MGQNQMNVVLEPLQTQKFVSTISGSRSVLWLFVFYFNQNVSELLLASLLGNYFNSFNKIALNSQIYVLSYSKMALLFEVYRKMPAWNLTVSLLCSLNQTSNSVGYLNKNDVVVRRKDLTGIYFRVGYLPNEAFFYEENEAS